MLASGLSTPEESLFCKMEFDNPVNASTRIKGGDGGGKPNRSRFLRT